MVTLRIMEIIVRPIQFLIPLSILVLSTSPSLAGDPPSRGASAGYDPDAWIVTLKGNVTVSPEWNGSDQFSLFGYPSLSIRRPWEKPVWYSPDDNIDYAFYKNQLVAVGVVGRYRGARSADNDAVLTGLHKTRWTIEGGAFMNVWAVPDLLRARIEVRRGFRSEDGFIADLGVDVVQTYGNFTFAIGPRLSLADSHFMRTHYGVTGADALANGQVDPYRPSGGFRAVGAYASIGYQFNPAWAMTVHGGYERLIGDAGKSPIIKELGTPDQYTFGATVSYSFDYKWSGFNF